jgi:hypothetical protein
MTGTTNMNVVLGQGHVVKEVQNVKNSHSELNQQLIAQSTEELRKDERSKVKESDKGNEVELKADEEGKKEKEGEKGGKDSNREKDYGQYDDGDGNLIDIKV